MLQSYNSNTSLRNYSTNDNRPLLEAIAEECRCKPENIFLHNGSGPILKQAVTQLITDAVKSSPLRVVRHLVNKSGYPIITPELTYGKVPLKAEAAGLAVRLVPLRWQDNFRLDIGALTAAIEQGDGLVYLANPNNPTGNLLITREQLQPLLERFPRSTFWIDEAYVQYVSPARHRYIADMVVDHPNLVVLRTLSFAYGLAAVRLGYLLARADFVRKLESGLTDYRIPALNEALCLAALRDPQHLDWVRQASAEARAQLTEGMAKHPGLVVYPSEANFLLVRITDGKPAKEIAARVLERGIKIKTFSPLQGRTFSDLFRVTIGTPEENALFLRILDEVLTTW